MEDQFLKNLINLKEDLKNFKLVNSDLNNTIRKLKIDIRNLEIELSKEKEKNAELIKNQDDLNQLPNLRSQIEELKEKSKSDESMIFHYLKEIELKDKVIDGLEFRILNYKKAVEEDVPASNKRRLSNNINSHSKRFKSDHEPSSTTINKDGVSRCNLS